MSSRVEFTENFLEKILALSLEDVSTSKKEGELKTY